MQKNIFVLYTGGTIGMRQSPDGLTPDTALADRALTPFADRYRFHWHLTEPLIDSSAVTLHHWQKWLGIIRNALAQYDGILILHGTDTLAYTANLMALALPQNKPIVLTGAQWPFGAPNSDAPHNLECAVAAFDLPLRQTVIAFHGKLFPAVGSSKTSTETADGFVNLHFGSLAQRGKHQWHTAATLPETPVPCADTALRLNPDAVVECYTLIPGAMSAHIARQLSATRAAAVILQSYGHGNTPADPELIRAAADFCARGGLLLNISQVAQGCAAAVYAQGSSLRQAGVISGGKCNLETAAVLMTLAAGNGWTAAQVSEHLQRLKLW